MKKIILVTLLFISAKCFAQRDFDYTIYTTHCSLPDSGKGNPKLLMQRKIVKKANVIKIISLVNTGDVITYTVRYIGYEPNANAFTYLSTDGVVIAINPVAPMVKLLFKNKPIQMFY